MAWFWVTGASPGASLSFLTSDLLGGWTKPQPPCLGLELELDAPSLATTATADGRGEVILEPELDVEACGRFVQVVDSGSCLVSNVDSLP